MRLREFGSAVIVTITSVGLVLGALSISLVEFIPEATSTATFVLPASPQAVTATITPLPSNTADPNIATPAFTFTNTALSTTACQPPANWILYTIQVNDTLDNLAQRYAVDKNVLRVSNCLLSDNLIPNTLIYVPFAPTVTTPACVQGAIGWVKNYIVVKGDTMYAIASNHYTTVALLKHVNCKNTERINIGEILYVPNVATRTPIPSPLPGNTAIPYLTDPLTETALPFTATIMPSNTAIPNTSTAISTPTVIPTLTASLTPFATP